MRTMPQFMLPSVRFEGYYAKVWAGVYTGGRNTLHIVEDKVPQTERVVYKI